MAFPRWVARVNRRVTNRLLARLVGRIPNLAILHHRGRVSGTPVPRAGHGVPVRP